MSVQNTRVNIIGKTTGELYHELVKTNNPGEWTSTTTGENNLMSNWLKNYPLFVCDYVTVSP